VVSLVDAYAECERLARSHYENFPVASVLLPPDMRPHIAAIYAFARTADDLADEGQMEPAERLRRLDDHLMRLHAAVDRAHPRNADTADVGQDDPSGAIFTALAASIRTCRLPTALFEDLVSAFKQDVSTTRYETWDALLDYCRRSANPVGRLVLRVAGHADGALDSASDAVCTALQLTNFWQDVEVDQRKGRVYLPRDVRESFGAREEHLDAGTISAEWRQALGEACARTRTLFDAGRPVCDGVTGRLRYELRFTWLGGRRILDKLEQTGFDVFVSRPTLGVADVPALLWDAIAWKASDRTMDAGSRTRGLTTPGSGVRDSINQKPGTSNQEPRGRT
jgi:squalene synthase HpnC